MIRVTHTRPADPHVASWLRGILIPACQAAGIDSPPALELRQTGCWSGWMSHDKGSHPERQVVLSSHTVLFWTRKRIVRSYIHETCHRLLDEGHGHDAAFYALNLALLARIDLAHPPADPGLAYRVGMSLYDIQDAPSTWTELPHHIWRTRAMAWAERQAADLSTSDMPAERLAAEIKRRYSAWEREISDEPSRVARAKANQALMEKRRKDRQRRLVLVAAAGWIIAALASFLLIQRV